MRAIGIIPARYAATRLPGKLILPEAKEATGKYILEHVYSNACQAETLSKVLIATDDERIHSLVERFGGEAKMTPGGLESGTDRIAWVLRNVSSVEALNPDIVVNIQGDEPGIGGNTIDEVVGALSSDGDAVMSTAACEVQSREEFEDPNAVKVVLDNENRAIYFSRAPIPFGSNGGNRRDLTGHYTPLRHIGLYAYRSEFLLEYPDMPRSALEKSERLEQLRALSNGYEIRVVITGCRPASIDTREDLDRFLTAYQRGSN